MPASLFRPLTLGASLAVSQDVSGIETAFAFLLILGTLLYPLSLVDKPLSLADKPR